MSGKDPFTVPRSSWNRRANALEMTAKLARDKTDAERRKRTRKRKHGALRVCPVCDAVSTRKRWVTQKTNVERIRHASTRPIEPTLCPGCARVRDHRVDGWVQLEGEVVKRLEEEIRNLVYHILEDARLDDPVHRVVSMQAEGDVMTLETTSQWLAETIGKAVERDLGGKLAIRFIPDEEFVRVYWRQESADASTKSG